MLAAERVLGPRWTPKELQVFYILLRALSVTATSSIGSMDSVQWSKLERKLPTRTPAMICALFGMHREYLSLPDASVEGFCALVADYYRAVDEELSRSASSGPVTDGPSADAATPDADIKMEVMEDEPNTSRDREMDAATRIRKRENSLTPTSAAADIANALSSLPSASATVKTEKKKRKLERFLAWEAAGDQLELQAQLHLQIKSDDDEAAAFGAGARRSGARDSRRAVKSTPSRSRAWLRGPSLAQLLPDKKFELPWLHWFYSFVDSDFFSHNEFIDCLHRMGLGNIATAARPVWSSVRASMGRPRRLSPQFFAQEKTKLDNYRTVKRRIGLQHKAPEGWPFRCAAPLSDGATVLVCQENPRCFICGTVQRYAQGDEICEVKLSQENGGGVVFCSLDTIMLLSSSSPVKREGEAENQQQTVASQAQQQPSSLPSVFQFNHRARGIELPVLDTSWFNDESVSIGTQALHREEKISAILAVKDLLHRKEQLVAALATLNARVALEREANGLHAYDERTTNANMAIDTSSCLAAGDRSILQRQYAWIVVNLDVTNRSLQDALVRLQECSRNAQAPSSLGAQNAMSTSSMSFADPTFEPQPMDGDCPNESTTETLSLEHMKWAVSFLAQSQKSSSDLVASSISQMASVNEARGGLSVSSSLGTGIVLPETRQLISTCLCLMSIVRRGTLSSSSIDFPNTNGTSPPLVTQKLMERLLELLEPRHAANLDLYAELRSAAEGVQTTLRSSSSQ